MGEMIEYRCPNDARASAYHAAAEDAAGIVLLQEWWGLNEQMKSVARRCQAAGFNTLVPDLYQGRVTQDPDEAGHMMNGLDWVGATTEEVRGAAQFLGRDGAKVAVMGYCMGGALSIIAGVMLKEIAAVVCYYGIPPIEQAAPDALRVPFLGHFANDDDWCTPVAVDDLATGLASLTTPVEIHRYAAKHGFFNDSETEVYDKPCAALSWDRSLRFLNEQLNG